MTLTPFVTADPAAPVLYDIVGSPVGRILLTGDGASLTGLHLLDARRPPGVSPAWARHPEAFAPAAEQLAAYFGGDLKEFDVPLALSGSEFELDVWAALTRIPYGATVSYGEIALDVGKSLVASRAVGKANGRNPVSIIVPCHRVIGADGTLTGYGWGLDRKEWLLRHEGALPPPPQPFGRGTYSKVRDFVDHNQRNHGLLFDRPVRRRDTVDGWPRC